jgi:hypothetical protein
VTKTPLLANMRHGIIAGTAGGLAEIAWVMLYSGIVGRDPTILARGVTSAVGASAFLPLPTVTLAVMVHMILAMMLGVALAFTWRAFAAKCGGSTRLYPFILAALACVWAVNFFVALPFISPEFVSLVPYPVSLISKLLFGLAAAETIGRQLSTSFNFGLNGPKPNLTRGGYSSRRTSLRM